MVGMFFLGLFTRRCSKKGLYIGLGIGVVFIVWAALTNLEKMDALVPAWLPKYRIHIYWLGLLGNIVVFVTGYLASRIFSRGYMAEDGLTIYGKGAEG